MGVERDYWVHRRAGQLWHGRLRHKRWRPARSRTTTRRTLTLKRRQTAYPPLWNARTSETLLYAQKLNSVFGIPGSGKSWVAAIAIDAAVFRGGRVMLWDHEDSAQTFKRRTMMLGFDPLQQADSFRYVTPSHGRDSPTAIEEAFKTWLAARCRPRVLACGHRRGGIGGMPK